ncbi:hypothetical protein D3C75_552980 [compost metagenome]
MHEAQLRSMQGVSAAGVGLPVLRSAVHGISDQGMSQIGHMHPDLVGPPCFQADRQQGGVLEMLHHSVVGNRGITIRGNDPVMGRIRVAVNRRIHRSRLLHKPAVDQGDVFLFHCSRLHLFGNMLVDVRVLGNGENPGGFPVQTVHGTEADAQAPLLPHMDHTVGKGTGPMSRSRMHNDPRRFVDNQQMIILKNHIHRQILGENILGILLLHPHLHHIPRFDANAGILALPVDRNAFLRLLQTGQELAGQGHSPAEDRLELQAVIPLRDNIRNRLVIAHDFLRNTSPLRSYSESGTPSRWLAALAIVKNKSDSRLR